MLRRNLNVNGKTVRVVKEKDPHNAHGRIKVDLVIEASGKFRSRDKCELHLGAGAEPS